MRIELTINGKLVEITNEHPASSYGQPVAVFDGKAYGPNDNLPLWEGEPVDFLKEPASTTISAALKEQDFRLLPCEEAFVRKFIYVMD